MIIFDLDGTLSLVGDRRHLVFGKKKDWDAFFDACDTDAPNLPIIRLYHQLGHVQKKIVTGRPERVRAKTQAWLQHYGIYVAEEDLVMRQDEDTRHDTLVKPELIATFQAQIDLIFEDRNSMVALWREMGLCCVQVAEGDF